MTKVMERKSAGTAIGHLAKTLQQTQQGYRPGSQTIGGGATNPNPRFDTIGIGDVILRPDVTAPGPAAGLTGLRLTPGSYLDDTWVDVEWSAPTDGNAVQYHVEYAIKNTANNTYTLQEVLVAGGNSRRVSGLRPSTVYGFRVSSLNRVGRFSETFPAGGGYQDVTTIGDTTIPSQITGLSVIAGYQSVNVQWNESAEADVANGNGLYEVQLDTVSSFNSVNLKTVRVSATLASFTGLALNTTYFVRVAPIDASGNQGIYSSIVSVTTEGQMTAKPSDGIPPSSSPSMKRVSPGPGYIFIEWDAITNTDPVTYDIHISLTSGFTPSATTLLSSTPGTFAFIRKMPNGNMLSYDSWHYTKIVARDADGSAPAGAQVASFPLKLGASDIQAGTITAASALIADAAIGTAQIVDASIITAKIADAAITNAKIATAAIDSAHIQDAAIVRAKIALAAIDDARIASLSATKITFGTMNGDRIAANTLDANRLTTSTLDAATITLLGGAFRALRTADSAVGMLINSQGISMYDAQGIRKIFLDAQTGNGAYTGNVDASTITASTLTGNVINGGQIFGAYYFTGGPSVYPRLEIFPHSTAWGEQHSIALVSSAAQVRPGLISSIPVVLNSVGMQIWSGSMYSAQGSSSFISLNAANNVGGKSQLTLGAWNVSILSQSDTSGTIYQTFLRAKSLPSSPDPEDDELAFLNSAASISYGPIAASDFRDASSREYKEDIALYEETAISQIVKTSPKRFRFKKPKDSKSRSSQKSVLRLGLIAEEVPEVIRLGDGWSIPAGVSLLWKGMIEVNARLEALEGKI